MNNNPKCQSILVPFTGQGLGGGGGGSAHAMENLRSEMARPRSVTKIPTLTSTASTNVYTNNNLHVSRIQPSIASNSSSSSSAPLPGVQNNSALFSAKQQLQPQSQQQQQQQQPSSGSDTDVSTSTENSSSEEQYALKSGVRQEPQGEEAYLVVGQMSEGVRYNNGNSGVIIQNKENALPEPSPIYATSGLLYSKPNDKKDIYFSFNNSQPLTEMSAANYSLLDKDTHYSNMINFYNAQHQSQQAQMSSNVHTSSPSSPPYAISGPDGIVGGDSNNNKTVINYTSIGETTGQNIEPSSINLKQPMLNNYINILNRKDVNTATAAASVAKNLNALDSTNLYIAQLSKMQERMSLSRSHPDLSKFSEEDITGEKTMIDGKAKLLNSPIEGGANVQLKMLLAENVSLRSQLDAFCKKVQKLQKFELEIQKVHQAHEDLMHSGIKKEKLEKALRYKLEIEVRKLQEENRLLKEQLQQTNVEKRGTLDSTTYLQDEIAQLKACISNLISENKEIRSDKERQEIELNAQRLTLQEQRNHISILDTALMNAQNNVSTLEAERNLQARKKLDLEEKTQFLKKALSNLQLANERRMQVEKRNLLTPNYNNELSQKSQAEIEALQKMVRDYQKKIMSLESEVSKWEQKYLEESALRSIEVSDIRDVKIAALERTSQENEKLITEARSEQLKHMDEIHMAKKRFIELESKLAEKEALIKVYQKHSDDRGAALQKTIMARRFNERHTRSASTMGLVVGSNGSPSAGSNGAGPSDRRFVNVDGGGPYRVSNINHLAASNSNVVTTTSSASQETRLSSKDSIIQALRTEKERYPEHYPNWRL